MTEANIKSGLEARGIVPFNPERIFSEAYVPSLLYSSVAPSEFHEQVAEDQSMDQTIQSVNSVAVSCCFILQH